MGFIIYRLHIDGITIYIGRTENMKERYRAHYKACSNSKAKKGYNSKKYLTRRQLNFTKDQFKEYVKYEILYENIPQGYETIMENLIIKLYKDFGNNLWNKLNGLLDENEYNKKQKNIKNQTNLKNGINNIKNQRKENNIKKNITKIINYIKIILIGFR